MKNFWFVMSLFPVLQSMVQEAYEALEDSILDAFEMLSIIKVGLRSWRKVDVAETDLDRLAIATSEIEIESLDFQEGDVLLLIPGAILEGLKVKL